MLAKAWRQIRAKRKALSGGTRYDCPCCGWRGVFLDLDVPTGFRPDAECPSCGAKERHRLQSLVINRLLDGSSRKRMLHFAPEPFFRERFRRAFGGYETADIDRSDVDHRADLQRLPMQSASYDVVFASHVLEHVQDDLAALGEIRRILRPSGIAVLPVPIVAEATIEYDAPNPRESMHVRAPGPDYFDRYRAVFDRVDVVESGSFPERYQLYAYETRPSGLVKLTDYVPICWV